MQRSTTAYKGIAPACHQRPQFRGSIWTTAMSLLATLCAVASALGGEQLLNGRRFVLPDGFRLEVAAAQPLVERPITASFDEAGRLYVADSSGSNDKVEKQLAERPHRILRLEDTDGDGCFDSSDVFADRMMFPEGTLWYDGSLYVAAPPSIWKLTDTDGDGVADERVEWFQGKTLTGCANDLHGPYLGRDGWIYWCKGAFAEQTYERPGRSPWTTRAAHIFRRHPTGGPVEPVMTGGMDNPVDVVFTPSGERIFSTTFLQHPGGGKRDGLIHAIYGGVYGKVHGPMQEHPRTGELMPTMVHLGAAAPCGLELVESDQFGSQYRHNLFAALFNMQKVTRHRLSKQGASFHSTSEDFLVSQEIDFHPTDILEDADGSLLVIDTGGWYKLCCPTSQLYKPDVLGAIYRVRRVGAHDVADARGKKLDWATLDPASLVHRLADARPQVWQRAQRELAKLGGSAVTALAEVAGNSATPAIRLRSVWTLARISAPEARDALRVALADESAEVQQAAAHAAGLHRDRAAAAELCGLLQHAEPQVARAAAEALGRIGDPAAVRPLLQAGAKGDRILDHSLIFAAIEIDDRAAVEAIRGSADADVHRRALIAADQMESGGLPAAAVESLLTHHSATLRDAAWWLLSRHPEWAADLAPTFGRLLRTELDSELHDRLIGQLPALVHAAELRSVLGEVLSARPVPASLKSSVLAAAAEAGQKGWPAEWPLAELLRGQDNDVRAAAIGLLYEWSETKPSTDVVDSLLRVAESEQLGAETRLMAVAVAARAVELDAAAIHLLCRHLSLETAPAVRALAVDALLAAPLSKHAKRVVIEAIPATGVMELTRLLALFENGADELDGVAFVEALASCPSTAAVPLEQLRESLADLPGKAAQQREQLLAEIVRQQSSKLQQLEEVLELIETGDIRRGQAVFNSTKASCRACHEMGYLGGQVGPDLTRIGQIRTERDLLESILYPSLSFVRSYEPTEIFTTSGKVFSGVVRDESLDQLVLAIDAQREVRIPHSEIEVRRPGSVSVMPAGLEKQLTKRELADLVKFLRAAQ